MRRWTFICGVAALLVLVQSPDAAAESAGVKKVATAEERAKKAKLQVARVASALLRVDKEIGRVPRQLSEERRTSLGLGWHPVSALEGFVARVDLLDPWGQPLAIFGEPGEATVCSLGPDPVDPSDNLCHKVADAVLGPHAAASSTRRRLARFGQLQNMWSDRTDGATWSLQELLWLDEGQLAIEKDGWGLSWWVLWTDDGPVVCSAGPDNVAVTPDDLCQEPVSGTQLVGIFLYLLILLLIGWIASRRMTDIADFFAAGKKLGFIAVAFSARATGESGWLLLGLTGMGAALGAKAFWVVLGEVVGVSAAWLVMSRRFKRLTDRYDSITIPDYLESRFQDTTHLIRKVSACTLIIFVTIYVSAQIDATGKAFEFFLDWNYFTGALVGFAVVMLYSTTGGFLAVAWSDVFQGTLMFLGLVLLPIVGLWAAGGLGPVLGGLEAQDPNLVNLMGTDDVGVTAIASIISLALIGLGFLGSPQVFVRFLALKDEKEIKRGAAIAIVFTILTDTGAVLIGMIGRYLLTDSGADVDLTLGNKGENVLPLLVQDLMPAFIVGLYIAVVLSAIMSTVDSLLVVASSAAVRDVYQKVLNPDASDESLIPLCRRWTLILGGVALVIALSVAVLSEDRTIFWFVIFGWSGIAATFCPTLILSLFWTSFSRRGALAAMIVGFVCVPLFKFGAPELPGVGEFFAELGELPPAFLCSFLAGLIMSRGGVSAALREDAEADLEFARGRKQA